MFAGSIGKSFKAVSSFQDKRCYHKNNLFHVSQFRTKPKETSRTHKISTISLHMRVNQSS